MRAPMIPGRKPDDDQREAMLRRLGIAEEKPPTPSRWDVLARDLDPVAPVQTPPPMADEALAPEPLPTHQPIPMAEAMRVQETLAPQPEPVMETPVQALRAVGPEPEPQARVPDASFMPGWGEESIPEDEDVEAQAFDEPALPVHESRWMDEPLAEAPRREELLPKMERPVSYNPQPETDAAANDQDLAIPEPRDATPAPVMEAPMAEPVVEPPVARAPVIEPAPEPVIQRPAPVPVPEPEPLIERVAAAPEPAPQPGVEPAAPPRAERQPEPEPAPPVDSALREMRAELEAMRRQFQTAPAAPVEAAPLAAAIPYDGRRRSRRQPDIFANARMVVWTLAIVAALWVTFHGMKAAQAHHAKQDHIMATVTGQETADDEAADQKSDN